MIVGLTGGIAAGKSTAAKILQELGAHVIDADRIARDLTEPGGKALDSIQKRFGTSDRKKLREIVFKDPAARKDLEKILHPLIQEESRKKISAIQNQHGPGVLIIYEAALLVETGRHKEFDAVIVVEAPPETRIERIVSRDGLDRSLAQQMIGAQMSDEKRRSAATFVIENTGDMQELRSLLEQWVKSGFTKA